MNAPDKDIKINQGNYKKAIIKGKIFKIKFKNTNKVEFNNILAQIKKIPGRRWNKEDKFWSAPDTALTRKLLNDYGFSLKGVNRPNIPKKELKIPPHLDKILYPFQKEGVNFLHSLNGNAILGDEMGVGKSIQTITYIEANPNIKTAVIICPASLKLNWAKECGLWMSAYNLYILQSNNTKNIEKMQVVSNTKAIKTIYIINYDIVKAWVPVLQNKNIDIIAADEVHFIKSEKSQRTKAVKLLAKSSKRFIGLSGTPIVNRPIEFYNALSLVQPGLFTSYWSYAHRYCGPKNNGFGVTFTGATKTEELHEIVKSVMIRRKKEDVLTELPSKIRSCIPIEINNKKEYNKARKDIIKWILENEGKAKSEKAKSAETLVKIAKLKRLTVEGKMKGCIAWIKDYLETNNKLIIFGVHKKTLLDIEQAFPGICVKIDGSVHMKKRNDAVEAFQNDPKIKLFLGNVKAAGAGLNLTAANSTCFLELPNTPGDCLQAEDRVYRIGQLADSVNAYYLIAQNTIEDDIIKMLIKKMSVLNAVVDGVPMEEINIFQELINNLKEI